MYFPLTESEQKFISTVSYRTVSPLNELNSPYAEIAFPVYNW